MAEFVTIARPYARALFSLAQQHNQIKACYDELKTLSALMSDSRVSLIINEPALVRKERADTLLELMGEQHVDDYLRNFVYVLSENNRLVLLPYVLDVYEHLMDEATDTKKTVIYTAYELDESQQKDLLQTLGHRFKGHLDAQIKVDPELIGGVKIEVGDQVLDLSIQSKLKLLYSTVKS